MVTRSNRTTDGAATRPTSGGGSGKRAADARRVAGILVTLAGLAFGPAATLGWADEDDGVHTDGGPAASHPSWMSLIPDYLDTAKTLPVNLSDLSIPGTHDSATAGCDDSELIKYNYCMAQRMAIGDQLQSGIRGLDLRVMYRQNGTPSDTSDDYYTLAHGVVDIYKPGDVPMDLGYVLDTVVEHLTRNPREAVVVWLSDEGLSDRHENEDDENYSTQHQNLISSYINARRSFIWLPSDNPDVRVGSSVRVPDLRMVRGKMVFFLSGSGAGGIPSHGFVGAFGPYNETLGLTFASKPGTGVLSAVNESFNTYIEEVVEFTKRANDHKNPASEYPYTLYLNTTAANTGATPIEFAAGYTFVPTGLNERYL